ncbi:MAG: glycosyltransferase family 39 protein [Ruminococcus sp.]|nr:glycosyltransferase family 39 protein [Ruminococcus sp.]
MRTESKSSMERLLHQLAKHPYLSVIGMCLLLFFFGFCEKANLTIGSYIYAGVAILAVFAGLTFLGKIGKDTKENVIIFLFAAVFSGISLFLIYYTGNSIALMLWISLFMLALFAIILKAIGQLTPRTLVMLMIAGGIMLRFVYVLYTDSSSRQHDVGYFNWTWGHANYIEYWYNNGLKLPDFDVRSIWQYYQPPLHHWLMALLLKVLTLFGMQYDMACQAIQILPMTYSALILVVSYRIFRWVKLNGLPLIIAMGVLCFHPTFVLMGGFYNNDILSMLLMLMSVMFALRWYKEPTLKKIIPIALCIGLGMMAKLSAWMAAPAIALMFLYVFVKNIKSWKRYIGQFAIFGVICAPLGLWWQIRNYFAFGVPITYVPYLSEQDAQYCGNLPWTKRLFDFGNGQLSFVYDAFSDPNFGAPYNEYNPTLGLIKTSLFGEGQNAISDIHFPLIAVTGPILFWIGSLLALLCFVAFVVMMIRKDSGLDVMSRVFFSVFTATMLLSYYLYSFKFPFTCSMNIRFCVPLITILVMGLGLLLQRFCGKTLPEKILRYGSIGLVCAFSIMTCVVYTQIG